MHPHKMNKDPIPWKTISDNFQCAKVLSIIMVMVGHYYKEFNYLWVPVTMGLFVFTFSSGFFTAAKYKPGFDRKKFWSRKFHRIFITLLFTNALLFLLFYAQGRTGIWTLASLVNILGFTGLLNWFSFPNPSPFGAGLWFLTLLYLFYIIYPHINMGHSLWLTSCGFIWGLVIQHHGKGHKTIWALFFMMGSILIMGVNNILFTIKIYNFPLILVSALCLCLILTKWRLPLFMIQLTKPLNGSIFFFFIYLLHPYLFVPLSSNGILNTIICVILVCITGKFLDTFLSTSSIFASTLLQKVRI